MSSFDNEKVKKLYDTMKNANTNGDIKLGDWASNEIVNCDANNPYFIYQNIQRYMLKGYGKDYLPTYLHQLSRMEQLVFDNPTNHNFKITLARYYVMFGMFNQAAILIKQIPETTQDYYILQCKAWLYTYQGNFSESKKIWDFLSHYLYLGSIADKSNTLKLEKKHQVILNPKSVLLFAFCRNEINKLPLFLKYYRDLGVSAFFIADNGSDDGSFEYLSEQKDVQLFRTFESFRQSEYGVSWLNEMIKQYGDDYWLIHVDIDEVLIYPNCENIGVVEFTQQLEVEKANIVRGMVIEMFPKKLEDSYINQQQYLHHQQPYFYNDYAIFHSINPPYIDPRGGILSMLMNGKYMLYSKTPIIKGNQGIKYLISSHVVTPSIISKQSCAVLHFKFLDNFYDKFKIEIERNEHASNSSSYKSYLNAVSELPVDYDFTSLPQTTLFRNSQQLLDLKLISC